ncbi:MAG TPA: amidohydrolase family protein [Steroidobacter sp.]
MLIEGERIAAVGRAAQIRIPAGARVIDAKGKYLIPGLMDANVHLFLDLRPAILEKYEGRYDLLIEEAAQITLRAGVTTVFDSWGPLEPLAAVRERIASGAVPGSRIFFAGNILGFGGPLSSDFLITRKPEDSSFTRKINAQWEQGVGPELHWMTVAEVERAVARYLDTKPVDFIKYGASGHHDMKLLAFSREAQAAIVRLARSRRKPVQAHTTSVESLRIALAAGVDLLQHCDVTGPVRMPRSLVELIKDQNVYCAVLPLTEWRLKYELETLWQDTLWGEILATKDVNDRKLIAAGAPLVLSTDGGVRAHDIARDPERGHWYRNRKDEPTRLGTAHFTWFEAMSERGYPPMSALLAATRNVAHAYGVLDELGTIETGKLADMLILGGNPLEDVSNYRRIDQVIQNGRVVDRASLPRTPLLTARSDEHGPE